MKVRCFIIMFVLAVLAAAIPTYIDWQANPGGVFQGPDGTHWPAVLETAWTWFWPIFLVALLVTVIIHGLVTARRARD